MAEDIQFGVKRRRAHHGLGDAPDLCTPEAERGTFLRYNPNPNLTLTLKPYLPMLTASISAAACGKIWQE